MHNESARSLDNEIFKWKIINNRSHVVLSAQQVGHP